MCSVFPDSSMIATVSAFKNKDSRRMTAPSGTGVFIGLVRCTVCVCLVLLVHLYFISEQQFHPDKHARL